MGKHDWLIGVLAELEEYSAKNGLLALKEYLSLTIAIAISSTEDPVNTGNTISLESRRPLRSSSDGISIIQTFADQLQEML